MDNYFAHSRSVLFENGHVLTKDMLVESYVYPRTLTQILTNRLDDCIIAGFRFDVRNDDVFLSPGCFKSQKMIYLFESEVNLQELWKDFKNRSGELKLGGGDMVYLKFSSDEVDNDKTYHDVRDKVMKLEFASKFSDEDFVIGRLQFINDRVMLPDSIGDLKKGNCLELLDVKYGYNGAITFHPQVFRCIINVLLRKKNKDYLDWSLLMLLSNTDVVKEDALRNYVLGKDIKLKNKTSIQGIKEALIQGIKEALEKRDDGIQGLQREKKINNAVNTKATDDSKLF